METEKIKKVVRKWNKSFIITFRKEEQIIYDLHEGDVLEVTFKKVR